MGQRQSLPQYAVHAMLQYSGIPSKRHCMRECLLWTMVSLIDIVDYRMISESCPFEAVLLSRRLCRPGFADLPGGFSMFCT